MTQRSHLADQVTARMRELGLADDPLDALAKIVSGIDNETRSYSIGKDGSRRLTSVKEVRTQTSMAAGVRLLERLNGGALGLGGASNAPRQIGKDFFSEFAPEVDESIVHRDTRRFDHTDGEDDAANDASGASGTGGRYNGSEVDG